MSAATQNAASRYLRAGLAPVPILNGKDPGRNGWQNTRLTAEQVGEYFADEVNVGILTGEASGGVVDVDLDCEEAVSLAGRFLTPTLTAGRESRPHSHWWYASPGCPTLEFRDGAEKIVELRADGRQTLVAPSRHPDGDRYLWHSESGLGMAEISAEELTTAVRKLASATLIARHLPGHRKTGGGGRHDFALALAGYMLRPGRLEAQSVKTILIGAWDAGGWPSEADRREAHKDLEGAVRDTADKLGRGEAVTGGRTLEEMEPGMPRAIARYWGWGDEGEETPWEEPVPLPEGLPPVAGLDPAMLPEPFRGWLKDVGERMAVPIDFPAAGAIVVAGSLIGRRLGIHPKRHDDWLVVPNLWGMIVGRPAMLKTPALEQILKPLDRLVAEAHATHEEAMEAHKTEKSMAEAERAALKKQMETEAKKTAESGDRSKLEELAQRRAQAEDPEEPKARRYKVNDPTTEKLIELLLENPRGMLVYRDELSGFLRSLNKQGREGDRSLYLEAWGGTGSYEVDRIGRGSLYIPALCVSILGSIQPGVLSSYVWEATAGGEGDDGLLQRFQLTVWPDTPTSFTNVDRYPDTHAKNRAYEVFKALDGVNPVDFTGQREGEGEFVTNPGEDSGIPAVRFSPEAQEEFDNWYGRLQRRVRSGELSPALEAHLSKYSSLMPALALIFQLIGYVDGTARSGVVELEAALQAEAFCDYLETHARRLYSAAENPAMEAARALLSRITAGEVKDGSTTREIYRKQWSRLTTPGELDAATEILEAYGWIRVERTRAGEKGGRPSPILRLHPSLPGGKT